MMNPRSVVRRDVVVLVVFCCFGGRLNVRLLYFEVPWYHAILVCRYFTVTVNIGFKFDCWREDTIFRADSVC